MSIQDKVAIVKNNTPKVYRAGAKDFGLYQEAFGNPNVLSYVHPIEHNVEVRLGSKNLFDIFKIPSTTVITNNNDGTITISGTYSARTGKTLSELCPALKVGDIVVFSIETTGNQIIYLSGSNYTWNSGSSKEIIEADLTSIVTLYGKSDSGTYTISNIQIEKGITPTAYTPYISDLGGIKVNASGKNLVDITKPDYIPANGYDVLDNDSIRVYANRNYVIGIKYCVYAPQGTRITMSYEYELGGEATGHYNLSIVDDAASKVEKTITRIVPLSGKLEYEFARTGGSGNNKLGWIDIKNLQVEVGEAPTEYEPYIGAEYTANAGGTVEGVKSISPVMNLITEPECNVCAKYFVDINDAINDIAKTIINVGDGI